MKTYLELKVPLDYNTPWFIELREALKDIPVLWQKGYYHITIAFIDDTQHLSEVESIMHKHLDGAIPVTLTFDKLDVFTANNGMLIVHLGVNDIPGTFQKLVDEIRCDICSTYSEIKSEFKLHVTLGRITESRVDIDDVGFLIDELVLIPFTMTLDEVEYRVFRGKSIYKNKLQ